jgi:hypothetical protein
MNLRFLWYNVTRASLSMNLRFLWCNVTRVSLSMNLRFLWCNVTRVSLSMNLTLRLRSSTKEHFCQPPSPQIWKWLSALSVRTRASSIYIFSNNSTSVKFYNSTSVKFYNSTSVKFYNSTSVKIFNSASFAQPQSKCLLLFLPKLTPYTQAGFDLTTHSSASRDDTTIPRHQGTLN